MWLSILLVIISSLLAGMASAQAQPSPKAGEAQVVELEGAPRPLGGLAAKRARERGENPIQPGDRLNGHLARPEGSGPFPAVVVLPGCAGLTAYLKEAFPPLLATWGYVALTVDSFSTRNVEPNCVKEHASVDRVSDAYGGLFHLARLPFVDRSRIGVVGVSMGGKTALILSDPQIDTTVANPDRLSFRAGVAFYPPFCDVWHEMPTFPILVMVGQRDRSTNIADCERLAARRAATELVMYPDAHQGFLERDWSTPREASGVRFEYNEKAAQDSLKRTREFLAKNLGGGSR
jgi:dienelactone hydrolase